MTTHCSTRRATWKIVLVCMLVELLVLLPYYTLYLLFSLSSKCNISQYYVN